MIARDTLTIQNHTANNSATARTTNIAFQGWSYGEDSANDYFQGYGSTTFTGSGLDDLTFGGNYNSTTVRTYRVKIDAAAGTDTYTWSDDGTSTWEATGVAITGSAQELNNGINITFAATTGHTLNEYWDITTIITTSAMHKLGEIIVDHEGTSADDKGEMIVKTNDGSSATAVQTYHSNGDSTFSAKCYNSDGAHGLITIRDTSGTIVNT
tara:strand:+ start:198 stop:830 length:633 start_codon:yes stop_codon:yes gene_type:complete